MPSFLAERSHSHSHHDDNPLKHHHPILPTTPHHHPIAFDPARYAPSAASTASTASSVDYDDNQPRSFDDPRNPPASRTDTTNASLDDYSSVSTASSSRSDLTDATAPPSASAKRGPRVVEASMYPMPNGNPLAPPLATEGLPETKLPNGSTTLADRTRQTKMAPPEGLTNGVSHHYTNDTQPEPPSPIHTQPSPSDHTPTEAKRTATHTMPSPAEDPEDVSPLTRPPEPTYPPPPPPTSIKPVSPSSAPPDDTNPRHRSVSPTAHRLSSPPVYNPYNPYNPSSSSPALPTTHSLPAPGPGQLRQRHTLEVPKAKPRTSQESAFASGRFSPTPHATTPLPVGTPSTRRASLSLGRRNTRSIQSEVPRDEVPPDEDAMRWAEAYRQKRASKKRRRVEEDDDRVLVGTKVDEHHVNWVTAYNMLTGIRVSVSRTNAKLDRELTPADFETKQKSTFDIAGNELVPSAKYDFKFKDYAPWVFRHLRAHFRLDPADYLMSLTGKYILSELGSPGKSGSFFYFSRDYKYIIKTIHHAEHKFLRRILKDYHQHIINNPNTLLSQFYGLHRVKMPYGKKIHFVVMNNLFPPHRDIHQTFDLKGSTVGRDYAECALAANPRATLKDLNWMRRKRHLELGITKKHMFLSQLQADVALLKRLQIMDYSLLIGIHDLRRGNDENLRDRTLRVFNPGGQSGGGGVLDDGEGGAQEEPEPAALLRTPSKLENAKKARELRQMLRAERPVPMGQTSSRMPDELGEGEGRPGFLFNQDDGGFRATHEDNSPSDEVYYLGVIDCLTHYGVIKKIEHFWKGLSHDRTQISALPPEQYGDRFYHFVEGITMSTEEAARKREREVEAERLRAQAAANEPPAPLEQVREKHGICNWGNAHPPTKASTSAQGEPKAHAQAQTQGQGNAQDRNAIPPMPTYQPPKPPTGQLPPHAHASTERFSFETDPEHHREKRESVSQQGHAHPLPVVDEAAEASSTRTKSHKSSLSTSSNRPPTPLKDARHRPVTPRHAALASGEERPATPPKFLNPETADSGYGAVNGVSGGREGSSGGNSREGSVRGGMKVGEGRGISRESLEKELPPLPNGEGAHVKVE